MLKSGTRVSMLLVWASIVCWGAAFHTPSAAKGQDVPAADAVGKKGAGLESFDSLIDRASYAYGARLGAELRANEPSLKPQLLIDGLRAGYTGGEWRLTDEECIQVIEEFDVANATAMAEAQAKLQAKTDQDHQAADRAFLKANGQRPGVITTSTALQYQVLELGTGPKPSPDAIVQIAFKATLIDGKLFDDSGMEPLIVPMKGLIPGLAEGLELLPVGSRANIYVPNDDTYGGESSGLDRLLCFEIRLLDSVVRGVEEIEAEIEQRRENLVLDIQAVRADAKHEIERLEQQLKKMREASKESVP